jgi:hypothetical protein
MGTICGTYGSEQKFCLESFKERRLLGRTRHTPEDNIKVDLKGRGRVE